MGDKISVEDRTIPNRDWLTGVSAGLIKTVGSLSLMVGYGMNGACYALFLASEILGLTGERSGLIDLNSIRKEARRIAEEQMDKNKEFDKILKAIKEDKERGLL